MKTKLDKSEKEIERTAGLFRPIPKKQIQKIETIIDAAAIMHIEKPVLIDHLLIRA